jgi:hypothetical protein
MLAGVLGIPSRSVLLVALYCLGATACDTGRTASSPTPDQPPVVAAFVSDRGVGVIDASLHVRMLSRATSYGLAWSADGTHLAWAESVSDSSDVVAQLELTDTQGVIRSAPGLQPSALAWKGKDLYVDDEAHGLGSVSPSGTVRWRAVRGWHGAFEGGFAGDDTGARLAGATRDALLTTITPEDAAAYGGPGQLGALATDPGATPRVLVDFTHEPEGVVVNLPVSHVVSLRDDSVVFTSGTTAGGCDLSLSLQRLTSHGVEDLPDLSEGKQFLRIESIGTDSTRSRLFVSVTTLGRECEGTVRAPVKSYELVGRVWRAVPSASSATVIGTSTFTARVGPPVIVLDGGNSDAGPVGTLSVSDDHGHRVSVEDVWEFRWAGSD